MIFKSPHAPVTIPEISLTDYVLRRVEELGDKPALIDGPTGRTYTYSQLPGYIKRLAAGFAAHGVTKGDVLAIYSPNLPEYALAFHAVATLGAATTMVPPLFTDEEIIKQLKNSGAKYLLTIPQLMENARVVAQAIGIRKIFVIGEADGAISFASLLIGGDKTPDVQIDPREDVAAIRIRQPKGLLECSPSVGLEANAQDCLVVLRLGLQRDFNSAGGVNAPAAAPAHIALILARPHFRVLRAQCTDLRRKFDRRLLAHAAGFGDTDVE